MSTEITSALPDLYVKTGLCQGGRSNGAFDKHVMHCSDPEAAQDIVILKQVAAGTAVHENMDCIQTSNKDCVFPVVEHPSEGVEMLPAEIDCDSDQFCSSQNQDRLVLPSSSEDASSNMANMETDSYVDPETGEKGFG